MCAVTLRLTLGAGNGAQSTVCLFSLHAALSLIPSNHINWAWRCKPAIRALRKWRQEDFQFKVTLEYFELEASLRYMGACFKTKNKDKTNKKPNKHIRNTKMTTSNHFSVN